MTKLACPVCGSNDSRLFRAIRNMDSPTSHAIPIISISVCRVCGLIFQSPCVSVQELERVYGDSEDKISIGLDHSVTEFESRARLEALLKLKPPPCDLLEIGCSGGDFLRMAKEAGYRVVGIEPSAKSVERARSLAAGLDVRRGFFEEVQIPDRFDVVCHFHVLEHSWQPFRFLAQSRGLLNANGLTLMEVPNVERFPGLPFAAQLFPYQHITHFSPGTLLNLLALVGYRAVELDTDAGGSSKSYGMRVAAQPAEAVCSIDNHYSASWRLLEMYFEHREQMVRALADRVREWLSRANGDSGAVVVFGAGENGRMLLESTAIRSEARSLLFCDNNRLLQGKRVDGIEVLPPERVPELDPKLVIVASTDYQSDMIQQLVGLGVDRSRIVKLYDGF